MTASTCPNQMTIQVRFAEVDSMGIANHSAYFVWAQEALGRFMWEVLALDCANTGEDSYHIPVVETAARFYAPAHFRDRLRITTFVELSRAPSFLVHHVMYRKGPSEATVGELRSWHVFQRVDGSLCAQVPPVVERALREAMHRWPKVFRAPKSWRPTPHRPRAS